MKFNKLIPELSVSNIEKSLHFYTKVLGFRVEYSRKEPKFAFLSFQGSQIMIEPANNHWSTGTLEPPFGRGINFQIETKNVLALVKKLKKHNYPLFKGIKDNWYRQGKKLLGCREILVLDPDGYLLRFSQDLGKKSA
jgi:catechol 2,3-dioxygenase-like lactoylglutathione lyase family enzyme